MTDNIMRRINQLSGRSEALMLCADIVHEVAQRAGQPAYTVAALAEVMVRITAMHREAHEEMRQINDRVAA